MRTLHLVTATGALFLCTALLAACGKPVAPPTVAAIAACKELPPKMRRLGDHYGLQFQASTELFDVHEGTSDTVPVAHSFDLSFKGGKSVLEISFARALDSSAVDPQHTFSAHAEKRSILDDQARRIGEDNWGYLNSGERWREVRFQGMVSAKYGFADRREAEAFDLVINSVCSKAVPGV